jgi:hypothetical protein
MPEVTSVVAWNDGANTKLNLTIYHNQEVAGHYVDNISVTVTTGTANVSQTFPQSGAHTLDLTTHTFNVTVDIGPLFDMPLAQVQAHCKIDGWANAWTGSIPEYHLPILLLTLTGATLAFLAAERKLRQKTTA